MTRRGGCGGRVRAWRICSRTCPHQPLAISGYARRPGRLRLLPLHTRYFWDLRLHLICTPAGLPVAFASTHPKADEREVLVNIFDVEPQLLADRPGQLIMADKGYRNAET